MLLIASPQVEFKPLSEWMSNVLEDRGGLSLNRKKSQGFLVQGGKKGQPSKTVEFLGYQIRVTPQSREYSKVEVDIAPSKVRRLKTKVCRSVLAFLSDNNFDLLRDRLHALTANYRLPGAHPRYQHRVGIYYSYPAVTKESYSTGALADLDRFIRTICVGRRTKLSRRLRAELDRSQRQEVVRLSFVDGHRSRRLEQYDGHRIGEIVGCWKHV